MALVIMCCYDTIENKRTEYTERTIQSLLETIDFSKNRLIIVDNNSCQDTKNILADVDREYDRINVITLPENVGTARGVNYGIREREDKELVVKIDNDVIIHNIDWLEEMKYVYKKLPSVGILGLKRKDIGQSPIAEGFYKTSLEFLPHIPGEKWVTLENSKDIIGTCTMINPKLLDKIGFFRQIGNYGFDDSIIAKLSLLNGFTNYFLPHIEIEHIDRGDNEYIKEKQELAAKAWNGFTELMRGYIEGKIPMYYNGGFE